MGQETQLAAPARPAHQRFTSESAAPLTSPGERFAGWLLRGPLALAVTGLCLAQLAAWIPHYLTWPWFADHDVFATLAQGWEFGQRPYRDLAGNNFPGTIYLFWALGKLFGWGRTIPFYAVDSALLVALGMMMLLWSQRRFGRILPGAVGFAVFLTYYLGLDYSRVAQRDWHGPVLMVLGLLAAEACPGRAGWLVSAVTTAAAFSFRPQVVLFLPALMLALTPLEAQGGTASRTAVVRSLLRWGLLVAGLMALAFAPLVWAGVAGDFLHGVGLTVYGARYNKVTPRGITTQMLLQILHLEFMIVPVAIAFLRPARPATARSVRVWMVAFLGVMLYKPLSPVPFPYLAHPLNLVWAINAAVLVELLLEGERASLAIRVVGVLLVMGIGVKALPANCSVQKSLQAVAVLRRGELPAEAPLGYLERSLDPMAIPYRWDDYRAVVESLRHEPPTGRRVANLLAIVPALTGPTGRLSSLPAESIAWLAVKPDDEGRFREALERAEDTVVVWSPAEAGTHEARLAPHVREFAEIVRRRFEPEVRFGAIEVWRRKTVYPQISQINTD